VRWSAPAMNLSATSAQSRGPATSPERIGTAACLPPAPLMATTLKNGWFGTDRRSRSFVIPKREFGVSTFTESRSFSNVLMVPTINAARANVNHAGAWFYTGRTLNERLTLLRNR